MEFFSRKLNNKIWLVPVRWLVLHFYTFYVKYPVLEFWNDLVKDKIAMTLNTDIYVLD